MVSLRKVLCAGVFVSLLSVVVAAQSARREYRAFWVDTFNTPLNNQTDVARVVDNAKAAKANAIFAQVRRRGDSWYLNSLEPLADRTPIAPGFDPLRALIDLAHANGIEVHAFVIVNAIWNRDPRLFPPESARHVFNLHGGYDRGTNTIVVGPNNWLTRTLIPDGTGGISYQGHRFGADFWMEPGHPEAAAYTVDVLMHLVRNYDIDGLHLDRIRYPDISVGGQTPSTGASVGYNVVNVARFQRRFGIPEGSPPPAPSDPQWSQWRRDQVTNLVRRIYLNAIAIKPRLKVSAALIAYGSGPASEAAWTSAEAYWRVYQDWRAWTEEGILDIAIPMNYKREHTASERAMFDRWSEWTKDHQYNRTALIGLGAYLNAIEGTLRQTRRAFMPSAAGNRVSGVNFYAMANTNAAVANNPFSIPPGQNTPVRPFAEFASGLVTGRSTDGTRLYEDPAVNPTPLFSEPAAVPDLAWKSDPQVGHLKGFIKDEAGTAVDAGDVAITRIGGFAGSGRTEVRTATDGGGFYGGVDLAPGTYRVTVTPVGQAPYTSACTVEVERGQVATFDIRIDRDAPVATISVDPQIIWPPNNRTVTVTVAGSAEDAVTGIASVTFRVLDEYGRVQPAVEPIVAGGETSVQWTRSINLEAARDGRDRDGRVYTIEATIKDRACNVRTVSAQVVVPHDQRR